MKCLNDLKHPIFTGHISDTGGWSIKANSVTAQSKPGLKRKLYCFMITPHF